MKGVWSALLALLIITVIVSCSKEEDEIPLASPGVSADDFESGYIGIRLEESNKKVDSIVYSNTSRGFSFNLQPSEIIFTQNVDTGTLSKSLYNATRGDDVNCCVYLNSTAVIGITFVDTLVPMDTVSAGKYCVSGKY
ncbi:MAG: hypothetical protein ACPGSO_02595 [Vicingaceae bacterium]